MMGKYNDKVEKKKLIGSQGLKWKDKSHMKAKWICERDKNSHHLLFSICSIFIPLFITGRTI